jgi:hypothetical protein
MAQQVVTELVIDANTSGAADFSRAMDGAEQAANRGLAAALGFNTSVAALGAGAVAALAGLKSLQDYIVGLNKDLADMDRVARATGLSLSSFQAFKFGANVAGLSDSAFSSGLEHSASLLNNAQRDANSLTKLFDANGLSIKNANGQLISQNQLLERAADLVSRAATEQDKIKIAQMLGFTKEWVPFLEQGADAMGGLADQARDAGAIIDDDTIKKAAQFDDEWRKASVTWEANMKAAASAILPFVDDLILRASKFFTMANAEAAAKVGQDALRDAGVPDSAQLKIDITDDGRQAIKDFQDASSSWSDLLARAARIWSGLSVSMSASYLPYSGQRDVPDEYDNVTKESIKALGSHQRALDAAQDAAQDAGDRATVVPGNAKDTADAYDRAIEALERHTARTVADTAAVGQGAGALAESRAQAQLLTAAQQAGIPITDKVKDQMQDLAQDAGDAALALAKAKVANDNAFNTKTAFLTPEDLQIATQLKGIYGNDIPAALNSAEAAGMRAATALRDISNLGQDVNRGFLTDFVSGIRNGTSWLTALGNAGANALAKIADKLAGMAADGLWKAAFGGSSSGLLGNLFGGASNSSLTAGATWSSGLGAGTGGLSFPMFADGTDSAPGGWSIVGEKGMELVNLPPRSQVIPAAQTAKMLAANSNAPQAVQVEVGVTVDDDGNLRAYVKNVSQKSTSDGIAAYSKSSAFVSHVSAAAAQGQKRRYGK